MTFKVYLKANDRIFVNGAVMRVDRKTTLEFLNDVDFLLQSQILQPEKADTPLKQLYYVVQIMLMAPNDTDAAFSVFRSQVPALLQNFTDKKIIGDLKIIDQLVHEKKFHSAMKLIRDLFKLEGEIFGDLRPDAPVSNISAFQFNQKETALSPFAKNGSF